eukprot:746551-Hanusia_phi.AAC.9
MTRTMVAVEQAAYKDRERGRGWVNQVGNPGWGRSGVSGGGVVEFSSRVGVVTSLGLYGVLAGILRGTDLPHSWSRWGGEAWWAAIMSGPVLWGSRGESTGGGSRTLEERG